MVPNVGALKRLIESLPDDMPIVTTGCDHQYRIVHGEVVQAEKLGGNYLNEYYDDEFKEHPDNPVIDVLAFF